MSKLGYIQKSYGTNLEIGIANTYGYNILSGSNLPVNSIIIASPVDENNNDIGSYTILTTDYQGNSVRLTYTIKQGNGIEYSDDSIKVKIDNKTIIEKNKELTANIPELIDNYTIIEENNEIKVNIDNLDKASVNKSGLFKIDNNTLKIGDDTLYVDTSKLNYANPENNISGIVIGDNNIVSVKEGVISINQDKFTKASENNYGIISGIENSVINIDEGIISVDTELLSVCNGEDAGIVSVDNDTIFIDNNDELSINTQNLNKTSNIDFGVFKYDSNTFDLENDTLKIKNYTNFNKLINNLKLSSQTIENQLNDIDYLFEEYKVGLEKPEIYDFHCIDLLSSVLEKPMFLNQKVNLMKTQFISVDFAISTNCPFTISLKYEDNVDPAIQLYSINYDTIYELKGNAGLSEIYQTTQGKTLPLKFTFISKNYYNNDKKDFSRTVKIKITVSYVDDMSVNKSLIYGITRFNSGYNEEIVYDIVNIENASKK